MKRLVLLTTVLFGFATFTYAQFQFTSIDYPGGFGTTARGINNHGQIVGAYADQSYTLHALLIQNGTFIPLAPAILGTGYSQAFKINDRGDVVGEYCDDVACHGFLIRKGVLTTLDFPGASDTYAWGINESGKVVGYWDLFDQSGNFLSAQGFIWKDGNFSELAYPGSGDSYARAINAAGVIVGSWDTGLTATSEHGYVDWKGQFVSFDAPFPDVAYTFPNGINAIGHIVGSKWTAYEYDNNLGHGFLAVGSSFTPIDYPGAVQTTAWGINSAGQMVGNWYDSSYIVHGWLIQPGKKGKPQCTRAKEIANSRSGLHRPVHKKQVLAGRD